MKALRHLLVPVDGSDTSHRAVDFAIGLARYASADITFFHSLDLSGAIAGSTNPYGVVDVEPVIEALEAEGVALLKAILERARQSGIAASTANGAGLPIEAVMKAVAEGPFDAIVIGTHGRTGVRRFFLGSTAEGVLRRADVPVFVVPNGADINATDGDAFRTIEIAFDASEAAGEALRCCLEFSNPGTTKLFVSYVLDVAKYGAAGSRHPLPQEMVDEWESARESTATAAQRAQERGFPATAVLIDGPPALRIVEIAAVHGADLIAVGTHGRRGIDRMLLGSVAEGIIRSASMPVLVVSAAAAQRREREAISRASVTVPA